MLDCNPKDYSQELFNWWKPYYERLKRQENIKAVGEEIGLNDMFRKISIGKVRWRVEHLCYICIVLEKYFQISTTPQSILSNVEQRLIEKSLSIPHPSK
jgi:hypothetical protein